MKDFDEKGRLSVCWWIGQAIFSDQSFEAAQRIRQQNHRMQI